MAESIRTPATTRTGRRASRELMALIGSKTYWLLLSEKDPFASTLAVIQAQSTSICAFVCVSRIFCLCICLHYQSA